eukprot:116506-Pyramimonas_sp.AAC.1
MTTSRKHDSVEHEYSARTHQDAPLQGGRGGKVSRQGRPRKAAGRAQRASVGVGGPVPSSSLPLCAERPFFCRSPAAPGR